MQLEFCSNIVTRKQERCSKEICFSHGASMKTSKIASSSATDAHDARPVCGHVRTSLDVIASIEIY